MADGVKVLAKKLDNLILIPQTHEMVGESCPKLFSDFRSYAQTPIHNTITKLNKRILGG